MLLYAGSCITHLCLPDKPLVGSDNYDNFLMALRCLYHLDSNVHVHVHLSTCINMFFFINLSNYLHYESGPVTKNVSF